MIDPNTPHNTKDVICEDCKAKYCLTCQPLGCKCGSKHYSKYVFPIAKIAKKVAEQLKEKRKGEDVCKS